MNPQDPAERMAALTEYAAEYRKAAPLLPVDVQLREDAAVGAAWRRCEAALRGEKRWWAWIEGHWENGWRASAGARYAGLPDHIEESGAGPTPTAALEALAEKLEAR